MENGDSTTRVMPHHRRRALAEEVRDLIAADYIFSQRIAPGERLPGEHPLSKQYGVSRVTIRAALHSLRDAGLVQTRQGLGAIVVPRSAPLIQGLDQLCSLETLARQAHEQITNEDISIEELPATEEAAAKLRVPVGHPLLEISRVKVFGGARAGVSTDYVPQGVLPFDRLRERYAGSTLDVLLAEDVGVRHADTELVPIVLSRAVARQLDSKPGRPALLMDMVIEAADERPVCWGQAWLLPELFRFVLRRRLPIGR